MADVVLSVLAHPDDAEFICGGTLLRLAKDHGWQVHIASMTPGDCGSSEMGPETISATRRHEGARAARHVGGQYHCLEERDLRITYNERALEKVTRLLRLVQPRLVLTHSPDDYMLDHEMTSTLTRAAAFAASVPNFTTGKHTPPPLERIPHLYYCDPAEGKDLMGRPVVPSIVVDVSKVIEAKAAMLAEHASQREWLLRQHGMDHYVQAMRDWSSHRGQPHGFAFAEGFRQHLGHSYPQDDLLGKLLSATRVAEPAGLGAPH